MHSKNIAFERTMFQKTVLFKAKKNSEVDLLTFTYLYSYSRRNNAVFYKSIGFVHILMYIVHMWCNMTL